MTQETYRYCLSKNDLDIIQSYSNGKPLSENARKTLIILSEVFGGLHHLEGSQLKIFDYQSSRYNQYLLKASLATFDNQQLTLLVIIAHDMAVRFEIQPDMLDQSDPYDLAYIKELVKDYSEYGVTVKNFESGAYLRLLFHERTREGDYDKKHPTIEDAINGFRNNIKRYA